MAAPPTPIEIRSFLIVRYPRRPSSQNKRGNGAAENRTRTQPGRVFFPRRLTRPCASSSGKNNQETAWPADSLGTGSHTAFESRKPSANDDAAVADVVLSMASQGQLYTLCGFSAELDWRPLRFVEPVPAHRVCNACGVLPRVTAFLSCRHVLCKTCYERCSLDGRCACPLEGDPFLEGDVEWRDFAPQSLLSRKVKCWNEEHGCETVLPASELNKHFCEDCEHHSTSCPKCAAVLLRSEACEHLQKKCRVHVVSPMSCAPGKSDRDQNAMMTALNASLDVRGGEIKDRLDQVISDNSSQSDRLNEISHCMNSTKETLLQMSKGSKNTESDLSPTTCSPSNVAIQEALIGHGEKLYHLAQTVRDSSETLKEVANELKETLRKELQDTAVTICKNLGETLAGISEAKCGAEQCEWSGINKQKELALNTINVNTYEFYVREVKSMTEKAHSKGYHDCASEQIYICGYHMSPGVYLRKEGEDVLLYAGLQLHKGVIDEFLQWPFNHSVKLTVKHPSKDKHCSFVAKTGGDLDYDGRPEESSNEGSYFRDGSFKLNDLEREGYISEDRLWIVWEVVPGDMGEEK
ncbi:hypothetical protein HPB50_001274 [Hyalomma asiaticum]|uniref:Uncharacterized protein n=1 Tax=Hyalomma asiaticum TaxID=266040 RepID=A0ACB7RLU9_HYAAI|nr:hypothetical protein HPB50_001274 [Hyalomma asiaticum]